jgi:hypothetical protein
MTASNKYMYEINISFSRVIHYTGDKFEESSVICSIINQLDDILSKT